MATFHICLPGQEEEWQAMYGPPSRWEWDYYEEFLLESWKRGEAHLTHGQCWELLKLVRHGRPKGRGAPADPEPNPKFRLAAGHSRLLELDGLPTKAAVGLACEAYGVGRSSIFKERRNAAAREEMKDLIEKWKDPEERANHRRRYELAAPVFKSI